MYQVLIKTYESGDIGDVNRREVLRYAGMPASSGHSEPGGEESPGADLIQSLIDECIAEIAPVITYKVCYIHTDIGWELGIPVLPVDIFGSKDLAFCLKSCASAVLMAATVGVGVDRLIAKYERISATKALIMQALGAERVEALCDKFCSDLPGLLGADIRLKPRFSPGYGDLPLEVQKEFINLLDCPKLIGITLNDSLLMTPSKSVTAIVGVLPKEDPDPVKLYERGTALLERGETNAGIWALELALSIGYARAALFLGDYYARAGRSDINIDKALKYYFVAQSGGIHEARQRISGLTGKYDTKPDVDPLKWIRDPLECIQDIRNAKNRENRKENTGKKK